MAKTTRRRLTDDERAQRRAEDRERLERAARDLMTSARLATLDRGPCPQRPRALLAGHP
jgi:hypothetical protein